MWKMLTWCPKDMETLSWIKRDVLNSNQDILELDVKSWITELRNHAIMSVKTYGMANFTG